LFGGDGLALAALALVVFGAYDSYPSGFTVKRARYFVVFYEVLIINVEIATKNGYAATPRYIHATVQVYL